MKPFVLRPLKIAIMPEGEPIFSEMVTLIEIEDQGGGEHLTVTQQSGSNAVKEQQIQFDPEEWPSIKLGIEKMLKEIEQNKEEAK